MSFYLTSSTELASPNVKSGSTNSSAEISPLPSSSRNSNQDCKACLLFWASSALAYLTPMNCQQQKSKTFW